MNTPTSLQDVISTAAESTTRGETVHPARTRPGTGDYFGEVVARRLARRSFLKGAVAGGAALVTPSLLGARDAGATRAPGSRIDFTAIAPSNADAVIVPANYRHAVLIRWGDPMFPDAPAFDVGSQSAAAQRRQFGFNCDFIAQLPLPEWFAARMDGDDAPSDFALWLLGGMFPKLRTAPTRRALLWVNHEYTTGGDMFPGYSSDSPTQQQVDTELAGHGASLLELRDCRAGWTYELNSPFNRRITGETPIAISGPLAGHPFMQTSEDPAGRTVRGMLNNCGGGITPWGTILTAEENFDQYFASGATLAAANPAKAALYARLPAPAGASERKWERFHPRFDVALHPNEYARFGYIIEVDPYDPEARPRKRTALGRFKHEAAAPTLTRNNRVAVYSGDDARFEYVYKFVTRRRYHAWDRRQNLNLLDEGTLYVAKLNADGTGAWLPLVQGTGPLTAANGFPSQAEVLVNTRGAADLLAATRMDRPEDVEVSPVTGKVYIACTNNSARTTVAADPAETQANPRLGNRWGHVIEFTEDHDDAGALTFRWEIVLLCGDPALPQGTYFAGFDPTKVSPISCPDNLDFDQAGNLWIATDGASASTGFADRNDGIFVVPVEGQDRGFVRQFLSGPKGCEVASLKLSTDDRTLFATIQHPGEGQGLPNAQSRWPDDTNLPPRPSVVAVRHNDGKKIGR